MVLSFPLVWIMLRYCCNFVMISICGLFPELSNDIYKMQRFIDVQIHSIPYGLLSLPTNKVNHISHSELSLILHEFRKIQKSLLMVDY